MSAHGIKREKGDSFRGRLSLKGWNKIIERNTGKNQCDYGEREVEGEVELGRAAWQLPDFHEV